MRASPCGRAVVGAVRERGNIVQLEFIRKWSESGTGNCPALYRADNGNYVVQGWQVDDETRAQLRDLGTNETAVEVPADVIAGIVARAS